MHQPVEDQRRLDGLAKAHFISEQPANRIGAAGTLRDVELMREETHTAAEKRSEAVGLAHRQQVQDVHPRDEVIDVIQVAKREPLEQRAFEL